LEKHSFWLIIFHYAVFQRREGGREEGRKKRKKETQTQLCEVRNTMPSSHSG
jgi:hypothetical protein